MGCRSLLLAFALLASGCAAPADPAPADTQDLPAAPATLVLQQLPAAAAASPGPAVAWRPGVHSLVVDAGGRAAHGLVAVPEGPITTLAVVAHGWGASAEAHRGDLERLAARGALAVAMDYRGPQHAFKVRAGVEDTVAATLLLKEAHPGVDLTLLYGWSMGGEVALLAPLHAPSGTFDYVFAGAPVTDLEVFWHESPLFRADLENETGAPPTQDVHPYVERSPALRAAEIAGSGLERVFLLHGAADWPVPVEHSERMYTALADAGVPVSYYMVTKDRGSICAPVGPCLEPPMPAGHTAGRMALMWPFIDHRIARATDPVEPALRGTYDGETGIYEPSDTGP